MLGRINQVLYKLIVRRFEEFRVIHVIFGPSAIFDPGVQVCWMFVSIVLCASKAEGLYDQYYSASVRTLTWLLERTRRFSFRLGLMNLNALGPSEDDGNLSHGGQASVKYGLPLRFG